jgi:hypothetical protein
MIARLKTTLFALLVFAAPLAAVWLAISTIPRERHVVADRLAQFGSEARTRLLPHFLRAGVAYPPVKVVLVGLKEERRLQIYAAGHDGKLRFITDRPIFAAAGGPGPKLRSGDRQVPEGIYPIRYLNPNSTAYVSLMLGYPNAFDLARAKEDGRANLGGSLLTLAGRADVMVNERTVDVHISHLRKKLAKAGSPSKLIQTVRGVGYVLGGDRS